VIRVTIPANAVVAFSAGRLLSVPETVVNIDEDGSVTVDGGDKPIGRVVRGTRWYGYRPCAPPSARGVCGAKRTRQEVIQHLLAEHLAETERKATTPPGQETNR
jgi:hypothetical protein